MSAHWVALLTDTACDSPLPTDCAGLCVWALQYTHRVAQVPGAVLLELGQSLRLFGGQEALARLLAAGAAELGVGALAWAPTSLAALACARQGLHDGFSAPLAQLLDRLPLDCLDAVARHGPTLARLGCKTLGDVRRLPRGGMGRRFDGELLQALDQAYGLRPESYRWETLPETFSARLELPGRVDNALGLMFGARRLLLQMGGWLAARHCGVTAFTLGWRHDLMRARAAAAGGELTVRTAQATQNVEHLSRLLGENLAQLTLQAPAGELLLHATEVAPIRAQSRALIPDERASGEALAQVLERIAARFGQGRVLRPVLVDDHRLEHMHRWQPVDAPPPPAKAQAVAGPQPTWLLRTPLRLDVHHDRPLYQGPLQLLLGPQRVEGGWWHRVRDAQGQRNLVTVRDYWVALSPGAGALWIFQQRLPDDAAASWYLHGLFA